MTRVKIPEEYLDGEWVNAGGGFVCKSVIQLEGFLYLTGFIIDNGHPEEIELLPLSVTLYPIQ